MKVDEDYFTLDRSDQNVLIQLRFSSLMHGWPLLSYFKPYGVIAPKI